jgi:hypothetical protein
MAPKGLCAEDFISKTSEVLESLKVGPTGKSLGQWRWPSNAIVGPCLACHEVSSFAPP